MLPLFSATRCFIQKVFYPQDLVSKNLAVSWSGIFRRFFFLPKKTTPDQLDKRSIQLLSRDEYERLANYNFEKMMNRFPKDSNL